MLNCSKGVSFSRGAPDHPRHLQALGGLPTPTLRGYLLTQAKMEKKVKAMAALALLLPTRKWLVECCHWLVRKQKPTNQMPVHRTGGQSAGGRGSGAEPSPANLPTGPAWPLSAAITVYPSVSQAPVYECYRKIKSSSIKQNKTIIQEDQSDSTVGGHLLTWGLSLVSHRVPRALQK